MINRVQYKRKVNKYFLFILQTRWTSRHCSAVFCTCNILKLSHIRILKVLRWNRKPWPKRWRTRKMLIINIYINTFIKARISQELKKRREKKDGKTTKNFSDLKLKYHQSIDINYIEVHCICKILINTDRNCVYITILKIIIFKLN